MTDTGLYMSGYKQGQFDARHEVLEAKAELAAMKMLAKNARNALEALMNNKTCSPLEMTTDEREALWKSHTAARAAITALTPPDEEVKP